jgi:hypothetical protein
MARHGQSPDRPHDRPTAAEVSLLIRTVYAKPRGGAGCCMHSVTDDHNISDRAVAYTLEYARSRGHADCIACLEALAGCTTTQRRKAIALAWKRPAQ